MSSLRVLWIAMLCTCDVHFGCTLATLTAMTSLCLWTSLSICVIQHRKFRFAVLTMVLQMLLIPTYMGIILAVTAPTLIFCLLLCVIVVWVLVRRMSKLVQRLLGPELRSRRLLQGLKRPYRLSVCFCSPGAGILYHPHLIIFANSFMGYPVPLRSDGSPCGLFVNQKIHAYDHPRYIRRPHYHTVIFLDGASRSIKE